MIYPKSNINFVIVPIPEEHHLVNSKIMDIYFNDDCSSNVNQPSDAILYSQGVWYFTQLRKVKVRDEEVEFNYFVPSYRDYEMEFPQDDEISFDQLTNFKQKFMIPERRYYALKRILESWDLPFEKLSLDERSRITKVATQGFVSLSQSAQGESCCPKIRTTSGSDAQTITLYEWTDSATKLLIALVSSYGVLRDTATVSETAQK